MQTYIDILKRDISEEFIIKGLPMSNLKSKQDYYYHLDSEWSYSHAYLEYIDEAITQLIDEV